MRILLALVVVGSVAFHSVGSASAQDDRMGLDVSVFGSYWDVADGDGNAWGPGIGLAIPLYNQQLKLDVRASWFDDAGNSDVGDVALVPLDLGLSWHQNCDKPWDFYVMGGMSVVFADFDENGDIGVEIDADDNTVGGYAGAGMRYDFIDNFGVFTNVYYRFATVDFDVDGAEGAELASGEFDADGIAVDIGVAYTF